MAIRIDIHPDVYAYLCDLCSTEDVDSFRERLEHVRRAPIGRSEPLNDATSRYVQRYFVFGTRIDKIAIFAFDVGRERMKVVKCRLARPKKPPRGPAPPGATP